MNLREVSCKTALSLSGLYDYALNPYRGCQHSCLYCYAPSILREKRKWGGFVDVKRNIPSVLSRELKKKPRGQIGISTVTDAYQPLERKYEVTRRCLEELVKTDFPVCIQTKSDLVLRDLDLLKKFSEKEVGFTITTLDDDARRKYEPGASPVGDRISALEEIADEGIDTWVFVGPIMPYITDRDLDELVAKLADAGVKSILVDKLRMKPGLRDKIKAFYAEHYPGLLPRYMEVDNGYYDGVKRKVLMLSKKHGINCEPCF
ncbi:MAG: radical SAM protein [Candidatus Hydrothermarchaeaceae archaeon]